MRRSLFGAAVVVASLFLGGHVGGQQTAASKLSSPVAQKDLVGQYCVSCHNDALMTGNLSLQNVDPSNVEPDAETWEKVIRKVRTGMMPPAGMPRPDRAVLDAFAGGLEASLDRAAGEHPNPGNTALHRMNRVEYANAIRDLIGVDIDPALYLPADDSTNGFDNIAEGLGVSPALMDRYVSAAAKISRIAVGDPDTGARATVYKVPIGLSQTETIPGLPPGTRGGIQIRHIFPLDGEYDVKISLLTVGFGPIYAGQAEGERLEVSVNGERVKLFELQEVPYYYMRDANAGPRGAGRGRGQEEEAKEEKPPPHVIEVGDPPVVEQVPMRANSDLSLRLRMKAGPQTIAVTFLKRTAAPVDDLIARPSATTAGENIRLSVQYGFTSVPHLSQVDILGPYNATGSGDTPSRRKIFSCRPDAGADEIPCAREIISNLTRRAYRRPVTDGDMELLLGFFQAGRNKGAFDQGVEMALRRVLADPEFIFRPEHDPANIPVGSAYHISDLELASRLSFFLWSSIPDDELLNVAIQGKLHEPAVLRREARRMLADTRAEAMVRNFAGQWLYLRELDNITPDVISFPDFDDNLRLAFQRETELLFQSVMLEDRSVFDLLNADYTFVNERLAKHYGIPNVYGADFRRVPVTDARRGLLGQGSVLMVTSNVNRTSPVVRGKWVLENILGSPPPLPPPNVPPLEENAVGEGGLSVRQRIEQHRSNPVCAACHKIMDPIGLALENFDGVGHWRTTDEGYQIDASSQLVDGTKIDGPVGLRKALMNYPDAFVRTVIEKLMTYGVGREIHYYDMPVVREIARESAADDYRFSSLILGVVSSDPFQMRVKEADPPSSEGTTVAAR